MYVSTPNSLLEELDAVAVYLVLRGQFFKKW